MTDRSTLREAGFTLVEIVIAVAIVGATVAAGFGISLGSRSLAVSTAAGELDQFLDSARTTARGMDGAILAFTPDAYGDGTEVRLLAGGPNGPAASTTLPVLHARATIEEAESLGKAPFAFVVHANGSLSGRPGYRAGDTATNDVGCPASGAFHFVIKAAGGIADRYVPCRITLAANGPATLTSWPLATIAPAPTPCSGVGCTPTALPTAPTSTASCPPTYTAAAGGCVPGLPSNPGVRYHVTITGAPATINVGAMGSLTAQATLTNANAVSPSTPASIPVQIRSADATCAATPSGWQPSGSAFTVRGISAGICTVTAQADASNVPGATADTASATMTIIAAAGSPPTPAPPQCDLVANGKCYHRIVDSIVKSFVKTVSADTTCDGTQLNIPCTYLDSIRFIGIDGYSFTPPVAPLDAAHELLFKIDRIDGLINECIPFSRLENFNAADALPLVAIAVGGPVNPPIGFGQPSTFATVNHVFAGPIPDWFNEKAESRNVIPTLNDLIEALTQTKPGLAYSFTYSSRDAAATSSITWLPDFPGCDNAGDVANPGVEYGNVDAQLSFEVFQATE